jgi:predicted dehydrogenase
MTVTSPVRVGVIGTGWWATFAHIPSLLAYEHAEVVALCDPDPDRLQAAAQQCGGRPRTFTDYRELIASADVQAVVVATPHAQHYPVARAALDAGLHVLVEKPMTLSAADAYDLVERSRRAHLHVVVGYTYQFTAAAKEAREHVRSGALGDLVLIAGTFSSVVESYLRGQPAEYSKFHDHRVARPQAATYSDARQAGGGQGQTQVTHLAGMLFWVTGRRPSAVSAFMANRGLAVDLADALAYRLDGGAIGTIASTGNLKPEQAPQQQLLYYGTEGYLAQDLVDGSVSVQFKDGRLEARPPLGEGDAYPVQAPARCLVELVRGRGENPAPPGPAAHTVALLEAAYQSAAQEVTVQLTDGEAPDEA